MMLLTIANLVIVMDADTVKFVGDTLRDSSQIVIERCIGEVPSVKELETLLRTLENVNIDSAKATHTLYSPAKGTYRINGMVVPVMGRNVRVSISPSRIVSSYRESNGNEMSLSILDPADSLHHENIVFSRGMNFIPKGITMMNLQRQNSSLRDFVNGIYSRLQERAQPYFKKELMADPMGKKVYSFYRR